MQSICGVEGVEAGGLKEGKFGLALIRASGNAAAVFTSNRVRAAPVLLMEERIRRGRLEAIAANSGCANGYTGKQGLADAERMAEIAGTALSVSPVDIGIASTGVIGRYLDLSLIEQQCARVVPLLTGTLAAEQAAAAAIMTTDTRQKHALVQKEGFSVGGICKGSGMIAPNMGTMLAFVFTDAEIAPPVLREALRAASRRSFNRVVVDEMSTNDVLFCIATGTRGKIGIREFQPALEDCCRSLAKQVAADGEGATKMLEVRVTGAPDEESAADVAKTIISSPLVKTAVYGEDPNWGRVVAAAGRAGVRFSPDTISLWIGEGASRTSLIREGEITADLARAKAAMHGGRVVFELDLAAGKEEATAWGCDLTEGYVEINGRYTT
ncbi:MAG: bifunctional glutamate N-acetyltransferase/amino-acid acetyltransferase ArgJ [Methanomicrobiales archaeon]|nr:bifunctional glutamate N-acetyltransferase/amino-acid acetyltransferase ArgJ [Methanomicrobiales archaeon]